MFNVIDNGTGMKIDFMCIEPRGIDALRFQRSQDVEIMPGVSGFMTTPEVVILTSSSSTRKAPPTSISGT
jgi:hypothetical protein